VAEPEWKPLPLLDRETGLADGVITLPTEKAEEIGGKVLVIRCIDSLSAEKTQEVGVPPKITLQVQAEGTTHSLVSPSTYRDLGVADFGNQIQGRRLQRREWLVRKAFRLFLPLLALTAAVAAGVSLFCSKLALTTEIITFVASVSAASLVLWRAWKDP